MKALRPIRANEKALITFLLQRLNLNEEEYPTTALVEEYEGGKMGSISMEYGDPDSYDGDLIQAEYIDSDDTAVVITLTKNNNNQLLDLDFWKVDFSALITYPSPENLIFKA
jgi:hypothetical protein